jgi:hypothetical protein
MPLQHQPQRPSLLAKLLAPDIRAQHSRLLQALRFFVENDFLSSYGRAPLAFPPEPAAPAPEALLPGALMSACMGGAHFCLAGFMFKHLLVPCHALPWMP